MPTVSYVYYLAKALSQVAEGLAPGQFGRNPIDANSRFRSTLRRTYFFWVTSVDRPSFALRQCARNRERRVESARRFARPSYRAAADSGNCG